MKKAEIVKSMNGFLSKTSFQLKKHSPEILVVAGVIGVVTSAVMACKATTKVGEILDKTKEDVETIHKCEADESVKERYSSEDAQKDLAIVYVQTGMKFAKLYGPSVILGALSITSILASNNILRKRNVALSAAYAAIDKGFKEYRSRVIERFGEEVDRELKYNLKAKKFLNPHWESNNEYNLMFIKAQERYANDLLKAKKRVFLNEVYEMLGLPRTKAGQIVGWVYNPENSKGDNYIDFGLYSDNLSYSDYVNGFDQAILLDFNVDRDSIFVLCIRISLRRGRRCSNT